MQSFSHYTISSYKDETGNITSIWKHWLVITASQITISVLWAPTVFSKLLSSYPIQAVVYWPPLHFYYESQWLDSRPYPVAFSRQWRTKSKDDDLAAFIKCSDSQPNAESIRKTIVIWSGRIKWLTIFQVLILLVLIADCKNEKKE